MVQALLTFVHQRPTALPAGTPTLTTMDERSERWSSRLKTAAPDGEVGGPIDVARSRFPFCIVWTPLPPITWLLPMIGHMGIASSSGVIYDFAGPYTIGEDDMAFGKPTRYLQLTPSSAEEWDAAIARGNAVYETRMHNLFCDNCHSHVARALNSMRYAGSNSWNMVKLALWLFVMGKHVSWQRTLYTWAPFCIIASFFLLASYA
eukprot:PLAT16107.1.p1 GENE.PLAT16107.1~~PLAT16107.1.p1  ORF type:complete len:205 (-),score=47.92 PLAT16107.1:99-713(-)